MTQDGEIYGRIACMDPAVVFTEGNIKHPVQFVLDAPVTSGRSQSLYGGQGWARADVVAAIDRGLAADSTFALDEREGSQVAPRLFIHDALDQGGRVASAHLLATMPGLVGFVEIGAEGLRVAAHLLEDGFDIGSQRRLVVFDAQQVVGAPLSMMCSAI